jgi:3-oxoisoapionate decarboxylase
MQLGISSYTYTWAVGVHGSAPPMTLSAYDLIDKAVLHGLNLVQVADNLPLEDMTDENLKDLSNYSVKQGIALEMGSRGLTTEHTLKCLKTAERIHSSILRMVIDGQGYEPDLQTIINVISDLIPEFKRRNIRLAIENHDRLKAYEFAEIIRTVDSEWVGICLDSVNSMGAGEGFAEVSRILIPFTINLHIKDFTIRRVPHKMGIIIEGAPAGRGMLDIPRLVSTLADAGRCKSAILELWTPPEQAISSTLLKEENWASESIDYLKHIFL